MKTDVTAVINHVNTTLFNTGVNKNYESFAEFTKQMWACIDQAIEIHESDIFTFEPAKGPEMDDPFAEKDSMYATITELSSYDLRWSMNYFLWNRKIKRLLVFHIKSLNPLSHENDLLEYQFSPRSLTPV